MRICQCDRYWPALGLDNFLVSALAFEGYEEFSGYKVKSVAGSPLETSAPQGGIMSDSLEARIKRLEDIQEISDLQAKYSYHVDSSEIDDLLDLFADTFEWSVGFDEMTTFTSKPKLSRFLHKADELTPMMVHQPVTPLIEVDKDEALGRWYLVGMVTSKTPEGPKARWVQGRYDNKYVRFDGSWKFSRLYFKYNFLAPFEDGWVKTPYAAFLS